MQIYDWLTSGATCAGQPRPLKKLSDSESTSLVESKPWRGLCYNCRTERGIGLMAVGDRSSRWICAGCAKKKQAGGRVIKWRAKEME